MAIDTKTQAINAAIAFVRANYSTPHTDVLLRVARKNIKSDPQRALRAALEALEITNAAIAAAAAAIGK